MPQLLQSINVTVLVSIGNTDTATPESDNQQLFSVDDLFVCTIQNELQRGTGVVRAAGLPHTLDRPSTPPPNGEDIASAHSTPIQTPRRGNNSRYPQQQGLSSEALLGGEAAQHVASIPLAPLMHLYGTAATSAKRTTSGTSFEHNNTTASEGQHQPPSSAQCTSVRVLHRKIPLTSTSRAGDDVAITLELASLSSQRSSAQQAGRCGSSLSGSAPSTKRRKEVLALPSIAISSAVNEWNRKRASGIGGPREWQHVLGKTVDVNSMMMQSSTGDFSNSGTSQQLRAVIDVFISCEPTKLTECHLSALLDTSTSPSNMSVNDSICSNTSTLRSGVSGRGGGSNSHAPVVGNHFPSRFWEDAFAVHHAHVYIAVYRPTINILGREFDAAVEELVTIEALLNHQLSEKDAVIEVLEKQQHQQHAEAIPVVADQQSTGIVNLPAQRLANDDGEETQHSPMATFSLLKHKDTEIFLLRARIAAMEASRAAEIKSFRDEVAILRESRQRAVKERVQRAATSRRLALAMARSGAGGQAALPLPFANRFSSASPGLTLRNPSKTPTTLRNASPAGSLGRAASPYVASGASSSPRAGSTQSARGRERQQQPQPTLSSAVPPAKGGALPPASGVRPIDPVERDERLRKLEESYAKLQVRHAAARETANVLGVGSASAADYLHAAVTNTLGTRTSQLRGTSPARGPSATAGNDATSAASAQRRNISPLRVPKVVPGLKLSSEQLVEASKDPSTPTAPAKVNPLMAGNSPLRRDASPAARPKHSLLRTSPMRISETRTF